MEKKKLPQELHSKSLVSNRLTKAMSPEDKKQFEGSYIRSKRVLREINNYASKEAQRGLDHIDNPANFTVGAEWSTLVSWNAGYRYAMRILQEVTRT